MAINWEQYRADAPAMQSAAGNDDAVDWEKYAASKPNQVTSQAADPVEAPWPINTALALAPDIERPFKYNVRENIVNMGRGFTDIGEGLKQLYLGGKETVGLEEPGTQEKYTAGTQAERDAFAKTPAGKSYIGDKIRKGTASLPYLLAGGPIGMEGLLARILGSSATSGAVGATEYVEPGNDRLQNVIKSALIGGAVPFLAEAPNLLSKVKDAVTAPFKDLSALERKASSAADKAAEAAAQHDQAKGFSTVETGSSNPALMRRKVAQKQEFLQNNPATTNSNLPAESSAASAKQLAEAAETHRSNIGNTQQTEGYLSDYLNKGAPHDVRAAQQILDVQEGRRKNISNVYDHVTEQLSSRNVALNNDEAITDANTRLMQMIRDNQSHTPQAQQLLREIDRLNSMPNSVPADQYLTMLRSAKDYAREARRNAFSTNMNAEERAEWQRRYGELDNTVEEMEDKLESSIDPEDAHALKEANNAWRTQVKPLQRNTTYQTIRHRGRIEGNIINKLRGTDRGDVLMREIIQNDPEIMRNVVGQNYAENPTKLHDANELVREYTDRMPHLNKLLAQHRNQIEAAKLSENELGRATDQHQEVLSNEQKSFQAAEKERANNEKIMQLRQSKQREIDLLDKHIANLEKSLSGKNISLGQEVEYRSQLKKAQEAKDKARKMAWTIGGLGAAGYGIPKGISKLTQSISNSAEGNDNG